MEVHGFKTDRSTQGIHIFEDKIVPEAMILADEKSFKAILQGTTYLQEIPSTTFEAVHPEGFPDFHAEWVSREPVRISKVTKIPNAGILRSGAQIFTTEDLGFLQSLKGSRDLIPEGLRSGVLIWQNMKPEYDDVPTARSPELIRKYGLKEPRKVLKFNPYFPVP